MTTGQIIQIIRKEKHLTQAQLAERAGIAVNSLRLYEGDKRSPKIEVLEKIAFGLGVDVIDLHEKYTPLWVEAMRRKQFSNPTPTECEVRSNGESTTFIVPTGGQYDQHFRAYRSLDDTEKKVVDTITQTFAEKKDPQA